MIYDSISNPQVRYENDFKKNVRQNFVLTVKS